MGRICNPSHIARNARIREQYADGVQPRDLASQHGITLARLRQIVQGVPAPRGRGAQPGAEHPNSMHGKSPISQLHVKAGAKFDTEMSTYRRQRVSDAALEIGVSERFLTHFRVGLKDPTLTQLQKLAEYMGIQVHELLDPTYNITPPAGKSDDN